MARSELDHLKHRLEMTDLELQKTNATLRRLGDEMRSYSQVRGPYYSFLADFYSHIGGFLNRTYRARPLLVCMQSRQSSNILVSYVDTFSILKASCMDTS